MCSVLKYSLTTTECVKVTLNTQGSLLKQPSCLSRHITQFDLEAKRRAISQRIGEAVRKPIRK